MAHKNNFLPQRRRGRRVFIALSLLCVLCASAVISSAHAAEKESAFDRILRTGMIRCAYYVFPPVTYRDAKTGVLSGFSVDMMNAIGKAAGLKIDWAEEVTFGNWAPALQSKRFDAICTPMWPDIPMARVAAFTRPMFYAGLYPFVRADDARFAQAGLARFNQPDVTFLTQDGNAIDNLTRAAFPNAKLDTVAASIDGPTALQEIVTKKADAILLDRNAEFAYNKNNPVKLRLVTQDGPVKLQAFTLVVGRDELVFKDWFDNAIQGLLADGSIDRMLKKWEPAPGTSCAWRRRRKSKQRIQANRV